MEESLSYLQQIKQAFDCKEVDIRTYSPLTLAFLGDCVFDLVIRTVVVERANRSAQSLHKMKSKIVKAETQAKLIERLLEDLTEEELAIYKRGRNAKSYTSSKNASLLAYRKATGMEALIGYLYLKGDMQRILALIRLGLEKEEIEL